LIDNAKGMCEIRQTKRLLLDIIIEALPDWYSGNKDSVFEEGFNNCKREADLEIKALFEE